MQKNAALFAEPLVVTFFFFFFAYMEDWFDIRYLHIVLPLAANNQYPIFSLSPDWKYSVLLKAHSLRIAMDQGLLSEKDSFGISDIAAL